MVAEKGSIRAVDNLYGASVFPSLNAPQPPAIPRKLLRETRAPFTDESELELETLGPGVADTSICVSNWNPPLSPPGTSSREPRIPTYERLLEISSWYPS